MEEEQYRDILLLLELLTNLLSKDFIDLSPLDSQDPEDSMTAADVCLYGLNIIMPVRTNACSVIRIILRYPAPSY